MDFAGRRPQGPECRRRRRFHLSFQHLRQGVLLLVLLVVSIWGLNTYLAENRTFAWDRQVTIAVVALLDEDNSPDAFKEETFIRRFLSQSGATRHNLREVERWLQHEYERYTGDASRIFDISIRGPLRLEEPPPMLPEATDSFLKRYQGTKNFINFFEAITRREELLLGQYDLTLFIYFYDYGDRERRRVFAQFDSLASRRNRFGIVIAPVNRKLIGHTCAVVAHEMCHLFGASDKYQDRVSIFPQGFADPQKEPRYPQRKAEIMSLGRPVAPGVDEPVKELRQCIVGATTAEEMNWSR